ncbi:hypothetical protein ES703_96135 [subsurface metagenome]
MKVSACATLALETGKGPWCGEVELALHIQSAQMHAQEGVVHLAPMTHPDAAVQVDGLSARSVHLHILTQLLAKKMAMVSRQDDALNTQVQKHSKASPKVVQDTIHLSSGLRDVVLFAEFVDFLRGHKNQLGIRDALPDLLRRLRQETVQLGVENFDASVFLQESHAVLTVFDDRPADL